MPPSGDRELWSFNQRFKFTLGVPAQLLFASLDAGDDKLVPSSSCRRANYEHGCGEDGCEYSVSWRREDEGQLLTLEVIALVPDLGEDRWTAVLSLVGSDELKVRASYPHSLSRNTEQ